MGRAVLEGLLVRSADGEGPHHRAADLQGVRREQEKKKRLAIDDALDRLDGAGLIERRGGRSIASEVARRLDELMTL